jgi:putative ABC transport system permease protein
LPWREIIGVTRHVKHYGREEEHGQPEIYRLWSQMGDGWVAKRMNGMHLVVKTDADPLGFVAPIKREIQAIDNEQTVGNLRTMASYMDESVATRRFTLFLLGLFALLALLLGAVGVYGVMAYTVTQRAHELGVRMALGAQVGDVLKLILSQGLKLSLIGVAIGLAAASMAPRWFETLLFGVRPIDPLTFALVTAVLLLAALCACWIPARRATKVDPMVALRDE